MRFSIFPLLFCVDKKKKTKKKCKDSVKSLINIVLSNKLLNLRKMCSLLFYCVSQRGHELKSISLFWPSVKRNSEKKQKESMDAILCTMVKVMLVVSKLTGVLQISILSFSPMANLRPPKKEDKMRIGYRDSELSCLWRFIKSEQG